MSKNKARAQAKEQRGDKAKVRPAISVIVPMHNVAEFLPRCLDALLGQTLSNIEIICVDDNSTDNTLEVARQYTKHKNVRVIQNESKGTSATRNRGLDVAKAKYIMFCDADDYYEPNTCEEMLKALEQSQASVVICEINTVYQVCSHHKMWDQDYYNLKFRGLHDFNTEIVQKTDVAPTNKIFRKEIIDKYQIRFPEGRSYEDAYFCYAYFSAGETLYFLNKRLYNYVRRPGSTMVRTWSQEEEVDKAIDHLYIGMLFYDFLKEHGLFEKYAQVFWDRFQFCECFSIDMSKSKQRVKLTKELATNFIKEHKADFYLATPATRNALIALNPKLFFIDSSRTKRAILKLLPSYRLQLNNIERLNALKRQNEALLRELNNLK